MTDAESSQRIHRVLAWVFRTDKADAEPSEVQDLAYQAIGLSGVVFLLTIPALLINESLGETILVYGVAAVVLYTLAKHAWITRGRGR